MKSKATLDKPFWRQSRPRPGQRWSPAELNPKYEKLAQRLGLSHAGGGASKTAFGANQFDCAMADLLIAGQAHKILGKASELHAAGQGGLGLLDKAMQTAQSGPGMALFAWPLVFTGAHDFSDASGLDSWCTQAVADAMVVRHLTPTGLDGVMLPFLLSPSQFNAMGLQGVTDLAQSLAQALREQQMPLWSFEAISQVEPLFIDQSSQRVLRWAVGLCRWDCAEQAPAWLCPTGLQTDAELAAMRECSQELSETLTVCLGTPVFAGAASSLAHQGRYGAVNEAANGLLSLAMAHTGASQLTSSTLPMSIKANSFELCGHQQSASLESLTRVRIELLSGSQRLAEVEFDCRTSDALTETQDLLTIMGSTIPGLRIDQAQYRPVSDGVASPAEGLHDDMRCGFEDRFNDFFIAVQTEGAKQPGPSIVLH